MTIKDDAGVTMLRGDVLLAIRQLTDRGQDGHSPQCTKANDCVCGFDGRQASRALLADLAGRPS